MDTPAESIANETRPPTHPRSQPPPRPLVALAVAVFAGSWLAAAGIVDTRQLAIAAAVALLAFGASALAGRTAGARLSILALIACAAGLRGLARDESTSDGIGVWRRSGTFGEKERGSLVRGGTTFAIEPGLVREGERVAILPAEGPALLPRGPEPGPLARSLGRSAPSDARPDEIARLAPAEPDVFERLVAPVERLRARLLERVDRLSDPRTRGLVAGLLLGDLSRLEKGTADLFVRTGTFHVLAISGMQVVLVAVLLLGPLARALAWLLRRISGGRLRSGAEPLQAALLVLFVPVAGAGAPVVRSALACALAACAPRARARTSFARRGAGTVTGRPLCMPRLPDALSLWSLALACECLLHPDAPLSISVQLSYGATLGLILGTGPIVALLRGWAPAQGRIATGSATGRTRSPLWRVPVQAGVDATLYAIAASLAAVLSTLPFVWTRFSEWSPPGILATPTISLPTAWLLVVGWIWIVAPFAVPQTLLDAPARILTAILEAFDRLPGSPCPLPPRPFLLLAAASACFLFALARRDRIAPALSRVAALLAGVALVPWTLAPAGLELRALEVGAGTAVVLRAPGRGAWVFDAGSRDRPDVAREALLPLLRRWDAGEVGVVLSHTDRDHDGALYWLVERFPPRVWAGALPEDLAPRLPRSCLVVDVGAGELALPCRASAGDGLALILSRGADWPGNEGSRFLELRFQGERVLLSGDAEEQGLAAWLRANPRAGPTAVLLFPHHGSDTAYLGPLLDSARPREVWISAEGVPPVASELTRRGQAWRCTARDGPLALDLPSTGAP